ncbi:MAG: HlyD family efflux transporter periplasmic adaptor subunit [Hyphomicrobiales bacterium]
MSDASLQNFRIKRRPGQSDTKTLPVLRSDLVLKPAPRDDDGSPNWVLHDPIGAKYIKLGWREHEILTRWRYLNPVKIASQISNSTSLNVSTDDVENFSSILMKHGMLRADWRNLAEINNIRQSVINLNSSAILTSKILFPKFPLFRPQQFLNATYSYVAPFFSKAFFVLICIVLLLSLFLVSRQWAEFASTFSFLFSFEGLVATACALVMSKALHELAHAYASKRYGVRVPSMGIAFLVFFPVLFTETSETWLIPKRRERIIIAAAGMLAEIAFATFALLAWSLLDDGPLRSACFVLASTVWIMSLLVNLNPLVRFDGYFILSEMLGVENMSTRATALGQNTLLKFWTGHVAPDSEPTTSRRGRFWLGVYFIVMIMYRLFLYLAIAATTFFLFPKVVSIPALVFILSVFIAKPVLSLATRASDFAAEHGKTGFRVRSAFAILLAIGVLFVPFRTSYTAPAIVSPGETLELFAPEAAQIKSVNAQVGDLIAKNDVLVELESPELNALIEKTSVRVKSLELFLQRQITNDAYRESQEVQLEQLLQAQAERTGYFDRVRALELISEEDGVVTNVVVDHRPGRWINGNASLVTVVASTGHSVKAFFDEAEIGRLPIGARGQLMIAGSPELDFVVTLENIAPTGQDVLVHPILASIHDGPIAVRVDDQGHLIPERGIYLTNFRVESQDIYDVLPARELRGFIKMKTEPSSLARKLYRRITSILLRETGVQLPDITIR